MRLEELEGLNRTQLLRMILKQDAEINKLRKKLYYKSIWQICRNTMVVLITMVAVVSIVVLFFMPILQIYGHSMDPSLEDGDIIVTVKTSEISTGDIVAFNYNNEILVKRVIAKSGDRVNIDVTGTVYLNEQAISEPYVLSRALGECDIQLPYKVPDGYLFVMGDNRSVSLDSRNVAIGCIPEEQIVGKYLFKIWPWF